MCQWDAAVGCQWVCQVWCVCCTLWSVWGSHRGLLILWERCTWAEEGPPQQTTVACQSDPLLALRRLRLPPPGGVAGAEPPPLLPPQHTHTQAPLSCNRFAPASGSLSLLLLHLPAGGCMQSRAETQQSPVLAGWLAGLLLSPLSGDVHKQGQPSGR